MQNRLVRKEKLSFAGYLFEIIGWLLIVLSPLFIASVIGGLIYLKYKSREGAIVAISIAAVGLLIGIIWATRIWRTKGTINFLARNKAIPELGNRKQGQ